MARLEAASSSLSTRDGGEGLLGMECQLYKKDGENC
jgi:hypothetical protein